MARLPQLFDAWIAHLVERLARARYYVLELASEAPSPDETPHVVDRFLAWIDSIADRAYGLASQYERLRARPDDALGRLSLDLYDRAIQIAHDFLRLHTNLAYLPSVWARSELYIFVRRVLAESGLEVGEPQDRWSIVLEDEYNFLHTPLFDSGSAEAGPFSDGGDLFRLPKVEKDNVLMWPVLIHEVSHAVASRAGLTSEAQKLMPRGLSKAQELIVGRWIEEIAADLLAVDLLGPAYLMSYISFSAFMSQHSLQRPGRDHPSPEARITYMFERLRRGTIGLGTREDDPLRMQYEDEFESRCHLDTDSKSRTGSLFDIIQTAQESGVPFLELDPTLELARSIGALSSFPRTTSFPFTSYDKAQHLSRRVAQGVPIPSSRVPPGFERVSAEGDTRSEFETMRDQLTEEPNSIAEIMAAATIRKLGYVPRPEASTQPTYSRRLISEFLSEKHGQSGQRLEACWHEVSALDQLIAKSIENTTIVQFYRRYGEVNAP